MILRVFLCVVIVLMPVFLLGYNFMNGNVFDLLPSLFMASHMLSIEILVSLILGCGACMIFGKCSIMCAVHDKKKKLTFAHLHLTLLQESKCIL